MSFGCISAKSAQVVLVMAVTAPHMAAPAFAQIGIDSPRQSETITRIDPPAGEWAMAPNTSMAPDGSIILSWLEPAPSETGGAGDNSPRLQLRVSRYSEGTWSPPRTVAKRHDFFANWADLPLVTEANDGSLLAHWLQSSGPNVYAYDIVLARSTDRGESWSVLGPAHDDKTKTEHGFVSAVRVGDGVRLFWLDGRETSTPDRNEQHKNGNHNHDHGPGDMQLRTALVSNAISPSTVLDQRVCECCNTDAAMTSAGPIVVYRDRSEGEVRDISYIRRIDGEWTTPRTVHDDGWGVSGCPVNGPAIAARNHHVAVAWYTGAGLRGRVLAAISDSAGETFSKPIQIEGDAALGRVDIAMMASGQVIVCWIASDARGGVIRARRIWPDGSLSKAIDIARTDAGRRSGFPKLELIDDETAMAVWTHVDRPSRLRAATFKVHME